MVIQPITSLRKPVPVGFGNVKPLPLTLVIQQYLPLMLPDDKADAGGSIFGRHLKHHGFVAIFV